MPQHTNDERLHNPGGVPSFDNFRDLVTALKLQFLKGVPPTPENINRAQAAAEQAVMQGGGGIETSPLGPPTQQNASGGAVGVAADPSQQATPTPIGLPLDSPPDVQTAPLAPQRPVQAGAQGAEFPVGGGIDEGLIGGGVAGATVLGAKALHDFFAQNQGAAARREQARNAGIAGDPPLLTDDRIQPRTGGVLLEEDPRLNRKRLGSQINTENTTPGEAQINQRSPDETLRLMSPDLRERINAAIATVGPDMKVTADDFPDLDVMNEIKKQMFTEGQLSTENFLALSPDEKRALLKTARATEVIDNDKSIRATTGGAEPGSDSTALRNTFKDEAGRAAGQAIRKAARF